MKLVVLSIFVAISISKLCAHPAADTAAAAVTNATSDATAAGSKAMNASLTNATDGMSKLMKGDLGSNPLKMAKDFISNIVTACEKFMKGLFGLGSVPGMDEISKMSSVLKPITGLETVGKDMIEEGMKMFSGDKTPDAKTDATKAANATEAKAKDATSKAGDVPGKDIVSEVATAGENVMGSLFKPLGL